MCGHTKYTDLAWRPGPQPGDIFGGNKMIDIHSLTYKQQGTYDIHLHSSMKNTNNYWATNFWSCFFLF